MLRFDLTPKGIRIIIILAKWEVPAEFSKSCMGQDWDPDNTVNAENQMTSLPQSTVQAEGY